MNNAPAIADCQKVWYQTNVPCTGDESNCVTTQGYCSTDDLTYEEYNCVAYDDPADGFGNPECVSYSDCTPAACWVTGDPPEDNTNLCDGWADPDSCHGSGTCWHKCRSDGSGWDGPFSDATCTTSGSCESPPPPPPPTYEPECPTNIVYSCSANGLNLSWESSNKEENRQYVVRLNHLPNDFDQCFNPNYYSGQDVGWMCVDEIPENGVTCNNTTENPNGNGYCDDRFIDWSMIQYNSPTQQYSLTDPYPNTRWSPNDLIGEYSFSIHDQNSGDNCGGSENGRTAEINFTCGAPPYCGAVNLLSPPNNTSALSAVNPPVLSWSVQQSTQPNYLCELTGYHSLYINALGTYPSCQTALDESANPTVFSTNATSFDLTSAFPTFQLEYNQTYCWQVEAHFANPGNTNQLLSPIWQFSTKKFPVFSRMGIDYDNDPSDPINAQIPYSPAGPFPDDWYQGENPQCATGLNSASCVLTSNNIDTISA